MASECKYFYRFVIIKQTGSGFAWVPSVFVGNGLKPFPTKTDRCAPLQSLTGVDYRMLWFDFNMFWLKQDMYHCLGGDKPGPNIVAMASECECFYRFVIIKQELIKKSLATFRSQARYQRGVPHSYLAPVLPWPRGRCQCGPENRNV